MANLRVYSSLLMLLAAQILAFEGRSYRDTNSDVQPDPASKFLGLFSKHLRQINNKQKPTYRPPNATRTLEDIVYSRFTGELKKLFLLFPEKQQCVHLNTFARTMRCNATEALIKYGVFDTDDTPQCTKITRFRSSGCLLQNSTQVVALFWRQMAGVFNDSLTVPFQCNIISRIASGVGESNVKRKRLSFMKVEILLESVFPFLAVKGKCSKVWKPLRRMIPLQMPSSLLNITVRLHAGMRRKLWIRKMKNKAREIYKIYETYRNTATKQRPLIPQMNSKSRIPSNGAKIRMVIVRVTKFNGTVSVVFKLEIANARTLKYQRVSQAREVAEALRSKSRRYLNTLLNAKVLHIARAEKQQSTQKYVMRQSDITKLRQLFPGYLKTYYKKLPTRDRCLIMLYISSIVGTELRQTELLYNTYKYIPRKYFCSSRSRISGTNPIIDQDQTYRAGEPTPKSYHDVSPSKPTPTTQARILETSHNDSISQALPGDDDFPDEPENYEPEKKKITTLEIVLFTLLGMLCVAILVFTINCIIFAIRPKSRSEGAQPNSAFARALFRRVPNENQGETDQVNITVNRAEENVVNRTLCKCHTCGGDTKAHSECAQRSSSNYNPETFRLLQRTTSRSDSTEAQNNRTLHDLQCADGQCAISSSEMENEDPTCAGSGNCDSSTGDLVPSLDGNSDAHAESTDSINSSGVFERGRAPIKEGSGELKIVCESDRGSSSESLDDKEGIRTNNCTVVVVLDHPQGKEAEV